MFDFFRKKEINLKAATSTMSTIIGGSNIYIYNYLQNDLELLKAFKDCPELNYIIRYRGKLISRVGFKLYQKDSKGNEVEVIKHPIINLLDKPNQFQSFNEWFRQFWSYKDLFGNAYINAMTPTGFKEPSNLFNLPSQYTKLKIDSSLKDFRLSKVNGYQVYFGGQNLEPSPESVMHSKEVVLDFDKNGQPFAYSIAATNEKAINSILANYSTKVYLLTEGTMIGLLTGSGNEFSQPNPKNVSLFQEQLKKYGLKSNQYKIMATDQQLKYQSVRSPLQDLNLIENLREDRITLCNSFGVPSVIFDNSSATFTNKIEANKESYTNAIPEINDFFNDITNFLMTKFGETRQTIIKADYSNIRELQDSLNEKSARLLDEYKLGLISKGEYREAMGKEVEQSDYKVYYTANTNVQIDNTLSNVTTN